MPEADLANAGPQQEEEHFVALELSDCKVPIGCPWGADCPEDAFPDHHKIAKVAPVDGR